MVQLPVISRSTAARSTSGVAVAQDVGTVGAHQVQVGISVHVPKVGPLGFGGQKGPLLQRQKQTFRGPQVAVYARGNHMKRPVEPGPAFGVLVFRVLAHGGSS